MQKGTMITGIVDGVILITNIHAKIAKKAKEEGLVTEKETAYINTVFTEKLKEGSQYIEKVKELLSPKHAMAEDDKLKLLQQMHVAMKSFSNVAKKFEKGFAKLSGERVLRLTDTSEIEKLFKRHGV